MALGHHTELPSGSGHSSLLLNQNAAEHNSLSKSVGEGPAALDERLGPPVGLGKDAKAGCSCQERESIVWGSGAPQTNVLWFLWK